MGKLLAAWRYARFSRATSRPDERYRVCAADATTQEKTAGREPVAVAGGRPEAGRPARDGSVGGGGEGSSMSFLARRTIGLSFPLPLIPPPPSQPLRLYPLERFQL